MIGSELIANDGSNDVVFIKFLKVTVKEQFEGQSVSPCQQG